MRKKDLAPISDLISTEYKDRLMAAIKEMVPSEVARVFVHTQQLYDKSKTNTLRVWVINTPFKGDKSGLSSDEAKFLVENENFCLKRIECCNQEDLISVKIQKAVGNPSSDLKLWVEMGSSYYTGSCAEVRMHSGRLLYEVKHDAPNLEEWL